MTSGRTPPAFVAVLCVLLTCLSACSPALDQVFPTALPTATPTTTATLTVTPVPPSLTPTPDQTRLAALASATPVLPTPRPEALFTPTKSPVPFGALRIEYFVADVTAVPPGGSFRLFWSVQGIDQVTIYRLTAEGEREQRWERERTGTLEVSVREDDKDAVQFQLVIGDEANFVEQSVTIAIECAVNCTGEPITFGGSAVSSGAAQQTFERGVMIWVQAETRIYVLFEDGEAPAWATYTDEFRDGQPESDPAISPPDGLLQPVRGFGLIWRGQAKVRERLGWATAPEVGYTAQLQTNATESGAVTYITTAQSDVFELAADGGRWRRVTTLPPPAEASSTPSVTPAS
jgi:hypothetical protein